MKYCDILDKENIKKKTIESLRKAKETNREHGFNLCSHNKKIIATYIERGDKDSIGIRDRCPKGARFMGALHIHTRPSLKKDAIPSHTDIKKSIADNMTFFCVGTNIANKGIVRCFNRKDLESEIVRIIREDKSGINEIKIEDIDKSTRLIVSNMTMYKEYLDKHSCQKIL